VPGLVDRVDDYQRRHPVVGFPLAVVYKYFDDQGPYLAATLTYYSFIAIFPLLLIASSLLGFLLQGNEEMQAELLDSALSRFPIVGTQLGRPEGLQGSTSAVVIGSVAALYGMLGLGQAAQNALNAIWAVPRNSRLNPIVGRFRSLLMLGLAGVAVLTITVLSGLANNLESIGLSDDLWVQVLGAVVSVVVTTAVLALMMRYTTKHSPLRASLPGALFIAVLWQVLQWVGSSYVRRVVGAATEMNGVFALVLGLVALLFLAASIGVIGMEVNVVLERRLYPRALLTPFTDHVRLTDADRRAYDSYAKAQRHKGFQHVEVTFDPREEEQTAP
jgi:membrane protein